MLAEYAYKNERRGNLSFAPNAGGSLVTDLETTFIVNDPSAIIKIGVDYFSDTIYMKVVYFSV